MATTYKVLGQTPSIADGQINLYTSTSNFINYTSLNLINDASLFATTFSSYVGNFATNNAYRPVYSAPNIVASNTNGMGTANITGDFSNATTPWYFGYSNATASLSGIARSSGPTNYNSISWRSYTGTSQNLTSYLGYGVNYVNTTAATYSNDRIPVNQNTTYYWSAQITNDTSGTADFQQGGLDWAIYWFNSSHTYISFTNLLSINYSNSINYGAWTKATANITSPAGAAYAGFLITSYSALNPINSTGSYYWYISEPSFNHDTVVQNSFFNYIGTAGSFANSYTSAITSAYSSPYREVLVGPQYFTSGGFSRKNSYLPRQYRIANSFKTLYTVPSATSAVCSTLIITNTENVDKKYRIAVIPSGSQSDPGPSGVERFIMFDTLIQALTTTTLTLGITLAAGDKILVQSDSASLSFNLFGSEIS